MQKQAGKAELNEELPAQVNGGTANSKDDPYPGSAGYEAGAFAL